MRMNRRNLLFGSAAAVSLAGRNTAKMGVVVAACALALGARAEVRALTPTVWEGGNTNSWQMKRHVAKLAEIRERGGAPIVFVGDSITHFWEMDATWKRYFTEGETRALCLGTGGDRTEHVLWRITEGGELDGYEAGCVVVDAGRIGPALNHLLATVVRKQPRAHVMLMPELEQGLSPRDEMAAVHAQVKALTTRSSRRR